MMNQVKLKLRLSVILLGLALLAIVSILVLASCSINLHREIKLPSIPGVSGAGSVYWGSSQTWVVRFDDGILDGDGRGGHYAVRLVRGGP